MTMTLSRREWLTLMGSVYAATILPTAGIAAVQNPQRKLGLIFPPAGRGVPEEGLTMYGNRIEYVVETLGLETMTPDGYDAVIDLIGPRAEKLAYLAAAA